MSTIVGEVSKLEGIVRAINPVTGEVRVLEAGSPVFAGEIIQTSGKGGIVIDMANGTLLTLGRDTQMRLDDDVSGKANTVDSGTEGAVDIAALQQAVLEGNFDALEATAAGDAFVIGSASDGGVFVERIGLEGAVTSGFDTGTTTQTFDEIPRFVGEEPNELFEPPGISINDQTVNEEDGTISFTVSLTNPSASPVSVDYAANNGTA
ncbi:MAG: retention module-containing protein, partial [Pseudomonadota bacterium]|nr:retention module-containing protein [Pseudomonadota bacterium]